MSEIKKEDREILDWELSLDSRDLRAHAYYHGPITRVEAEKFLENDGDFLVRDCSSSGRPGDFVLSCRWEQSNLHFLILKDIIQKDTIYEQLCYRFENESFDTVPDLITYHVGSEIPISAASGALISIPRNRSSPLYKTLGKNETGEGIRPDYTSLLQAELQPAFCSIEKVSTLEKMKQKSLNLNPPAGLIEELEFIPPKLKTVIDGQESGVKQSTFDLSSFESILLPTGNGEIRMDKATLNTITERILETSERVLAFHLTKLDWDLLSANPNDGQSGEAGEDENVNLMEGIYQLFYHDPRHRWNYIIERSFTFSHFVIATVLSAESPEAVINKWINVAAELKSSLGNIFSFASIMRGLLAPLMTMSSGKVDWTKLRTDFTLSTFTFETTLRTAFQGYMNGTESYPPNTSIPDFLYTGLILEDCLQLLPISALRTEEDQMQFYAEHLKAIRSLSGWGEIQKRNVERQLNESGIEFDLILLDMFKTEFHLSLLWGKDYQEKSLVERCQSFDAQFLC